MNILRLSDQAQAMLYGGIGEGTPQPPPDKIVPIANPRELDPSRNSSGGG